jgi:hypothetical protein
MNTQTLNLLNEELDELIEKLQNELEYIDNPELIEELTSRIVNPLETTATHLSILIDDINDGAYEVYEEEQDLDEWD